MKNSFSIIRSVFLRVIILGAVFIISATGFSRYINQSAPSTAENMEYSTFPLVYMQNKGVAYNCLHGYSREMDVNYIRDTVTVLPDDHKLDIQIQPFSTSIDSVAYEILTLDGTQSLENTNVVNMKEAGGNVELSLQIQNNMKLEQEYILKLQVNAGGRYVYYYTRLFLEDGLHLDNYLDFVTGFYAKCVNKTDQTSLGTVVEPDQTSGTSSTLSKMNIHDTVAQLMWGSLNPQVYYKPTPSLVDINGTTASFVLEYRISALNSEGVTIIYNVEEFYRLRYTDTRVFLLDFTRSTEEVFNTEKKVFKNDGINFGISDGNIEFLFDKNKKNVAFVRENELWTYHVNSGRMTRVFGFPQKENMDYRDFYDQNNIKILNIDTSGNVWFVVSGYMNRGKREGENGIGIYYYEEASSTVEEILFIQTMESYDSLKLDIDTLSYIKNDQSACYVLLEGTIYSINLDTKEFKKVVENINIGCFTSSVSNQYFSYLKEGERYGSRTLCTIDLETEKISKITCDSNEYIRPICYMDEDLVYGLALSGDIDESDEGNEVFAMYKLIIVDQEGNVNKTYQPDGIYVMEANLQNNVLLLERATYANGVYTETLEDSIINTNMKEDVAYGIATSKDSTKQNEIILRLGTTITDTSVQVVEGKLLVYEDARTIEIPSNTDKERLYYVYAGGQMADRWPTAAEAIRDADEQVGVVIDNAKTFVWERGNRAETSKIKLENIPDIVKTGTMDVDELESALGKDVVSLTGCTLDQVLYFVGQKRPVLAKTPNGTVIITGYDDYGNLILLNPGETETYFYGPQDSEEMFQQAGNHFVSYLETDL